MRSLCLAAVLSACGGHQAIVNSYKGTTEFSNAATGLPPGSPEAVTVYQRGDRAPVGVYKTDQAFTIAVDYPSGESPHRNLGLFILHETVDYSVSDSIFDTPEIVARRTEIVKRAAAERGANAVFWLYDQHPSAGKRNIVYQLIAISSAEAVSPTVADVLARLDLRKDGYREVRRFTASLADLPTLTERVQLKAGHEYILAMAYHPEPVDLGLPDDVSLAFVVKADRDPVLDADRDGGFAQRLDRTYGPRAFVPGVDGVFARGGAGTMSGFGRNTPIEFASRPATIRFKGYKQGPGMQPLERLGAGTADFVVYERRATREELVKQTCGHCMQTARSCNKRNPLEACEELRACFRSIEQPMSACTKAYSDI